MKGKQVAYVLIALIIIGILGIGIRIISSDSDDFNMSGLLPITSDVIDRVSIDSNRLEGSGINLKKMNSTTWMVGRNIVFPPTLENFWINVSNMKNAQLIARKSTNHNRLGVSEDLGSTITFYLGPSVQEQFIVSNIWSPDVRLCYIRKAGKISVYSIPCSQSPDMAFSTNSDRWRNPIIVSIPPDEISSLEFEFSDTSKNFSIYKDSNKDWFIDNTIAADTRKIDSILEILSQFYTSGFEGTPVSFDSPDGSIRINTIEDSSAGTTKLKFLSKDSDSYYVQIPSQPQTVFIVARELIDTYLFLNKESLKLQSN